MSRRKLPGRFSCCCGRRRANERFSRKRGVCYDCVTLGAEEIAYRQHVRDIDRLLTSEGIVRRTQRRTFEKYLAHPDARVRAYAERVKALDERERQAWAALRADDAAAQEAWLSLEQTASLADEEAPEFTFDAPDDRDDIPF